MSRSENGPENVILVAEPEVGDLQSPVQRGVELGGRELGIDDIPICVGHTLMRRSSRSW
jgi:hypothetical protein